MSISQIRADLVTLLEPVVASDGGEVAAYTPDAANVFPSIWLGDAKAKIDISMSLRTWTYTLPITVAVARKGVYAEERAATEPILAAIMTALDGDFNLGGTTYGLPATEYREGEIGPIGGETLVGFTLFLTVKQKFDLNLTLGG